ncbi:2-oxo acid dehydrogenase subunit E2, partial [bacterium]|nr:2-oxo acid dehydrogenase subunit E2 [bacterium]
MPIPVTVPRLGWNMEEGTFVEWVAADGAAVRPGDVLFRLEGDKAVEEVESLDAGVLRLAPDGPKPGDRVTVGQVLGELVAEADAKADRASQQVVPPHPGLRPTLSPEGRGWEDTRPPDMPHDGGAGTPGADRCAPPSPLGGEGRPQAGVRGDHLDGQAGAAPPPVTPRARRLAKRLGIDPTAVPGTGRNGRVRERDVAARGGVGARVEPLSPVRKATAARMVESLRTAAPVTLTSAVDATNLVNLRAQFKAAGATVPSVTDIVLKLAAAALQQHPVMAAR